jgi:hypothetical protein
VRVVDLGHTHIDTAGHIAVKKRFSFESAVATFGVSKHARGRLQLHHDRGRPRTGSIIVNQVDDGNRREKTNTLADRPSHEVNDML